MFVGRLYELGQGFKFRLLKRVFIKDSELFCLPSTSAIRNAKRKHGTALNSKPSTQIPKPCQNPRTPETGQRPETLRLESPSDPDSGCCPWCLAVSTEHNPGRSLGLGKSRFTHLSLLTLESEDQHQEFRKPTPSSPQSPEQSPLVGKGPRGSLVPVPVPFGFY